MEIARDKLCQNGGDLQDRQDPSKRSGHSHHQRKGGQSTAGFSHEPKDFSYLYGLINKYRHDQCIDHGHTGDLSSGDYAGVDPAQNDDWS